MYALMSEGDDIRRFGEGSAHTTIYFSEIRAFHIKHAPLEEQKEIVQKVRMAFARIDPLTEKATHAAHLLDRLDERLLAKAFRGELVPQDPGDEPAEAPPSPDPRGPCCGPETQANPPQEDHRRMTAEYRSRPITAGNLKASRITLTPFRHLLPPNVIGSNYKNSPLLPPSGFAGATMQLIPTSPAAHRAKDHGNSSDPDPLQSSSCQIAAQNWATS